MLGDCEGEKRVHLQRVMLELKVEELVWGFVEEEGVYVVELKSSGGGGIWVGFGGERFKFWVRAMKGWFVEW